MNDYKTCYSCQKLLSTNSFSKRKRAKDGLQPLCKTCCAEYSKKYYQSKNKEQLSKDNAIYYQQHQYIIKANSNNYYQQNKENCLKRAEQYKIDHKEEIYQANKLYAEKYKEKIKLYHQQYYQINKEKYREYCNAYEADRLERDPVFLLRKTASAQIRAAFKSKNLNKDQKSILNYLPYSIQQLKDHLERQFEPWMNWNNYGIYQESIWNDKDQSTWKWQIDHIIPQSTLPYTSMEDDNFKKCWSFSNLRPYSAKQNLLDGVNKIRHTL